jgi:transposase
MAPSASKMDQTHTDIQSVLHSQEQKIKALNNRIKDKDVLIFQLQDALKLAYARKYGRSSERYTDPNQTSLFDEAELDAQAEAGRTFDNDTGDEVEVNSHKRTKKRGKRKPLPAYLPRETLEHRLPESALVLPNGDRYVEIGFEKSEQLEVVPASVKVIEHIRYKYAVKNKEELGVMIAPMPTQMIPKSIASSSLLAHIAQAKFCHHLPLYRQEAIWKSLDIDLKRSSMSRWMLIIGNKVQRIVDEIKEQIFLLTYIQADETPVTVLNDKHKKPEKASHKGYMWVYCNTAGSIYTYESSREGIHPKKELDEFESYVQTDAYSGYNGVFAKDSGRISVGCWAHVRRKFMDVIKAQKKNSDKLSYADVIIQKIQKLYALERVAKEGNLEAEDVKTLRQKHATLVLTEIKKLLDEVSPKTPPKGLLGKAVNYALNTWHTLTVYTENGHIPIDNNGAERQIKPFVIGRKNWLFSGHTESAQASANLFTLIENAKVYNLKPFEYLMFVFDRGGDAETDRDFEALTPKYASRYVAKIKPPNST